MRYLERFEAKLNIILLSMHKVEKKKIHNTKSSNCWHVVRKKMFAFTAAVAEIFQCVCARLWWQEKGKVMKTNTRGKNFSLRILQQLWNVCQNMTRQSCRQWSASLWSSCGPCYRSKHIPNVSALFSFKMGLQLNWDISFAFPNTSNYWGFCYTSTHAFT